MLVEMGNSNIHWAEPKDFCVDNPAEIEQFLQAIAQSIHSRDNGYFYHPTRGFNAAFVDGSVRFLPTSMFTSDNAKDIFAIGGCQSFNDDLQINWYNCIALVLWVLSVIVLLYWAIRTRCTF